MKFHFLALFFCLIYQVLGAQQIVLDEQFEEWSTIQTSISDPEGDTGFLGIDFLNLWAHNDDKYFYLSFEIKLDINLQDPNQLSLYIDTDNNTSTGLAIGNIGADLAYYMGNRYGKAFINGNDYFIDHSDIGFVSLPTVSSNRFELKIDRSFVLGNNTLSFGDQIRIIYKDEITNGDQIPDSNNGFAYEMNSWSQDLLPYSFAKEDDSDLRILSYNVERDAIYENGPKQSIERIISAIQPDIIAFQEIYDHGATSTANLVADFIDNPDLNWFASKVEPDIIMVSQHPIIASSSIYGDGNGAFLIRKHGKEYLFINLHLPCCDNNAGRAVEVANIIAFVDELKNGTGPFELKNNTPIIVLGDTNFVGNSSQVQNLINGIDPGMDWGNPMMDAKPLTTGEPNCFTWYNPFSSYCPGRLDYILYSGSVLNKKNSFALFTPALSDEELNSLGLFRNDSTNGSDHLATVTDFVLNPLVTTENITTQNPISISPNPVSDKFVIKFENSSKRAQLNLHNHLGQTVHSQSSMSDQMIVDALRLNPGTYYVELILNNRKQIGRIIKL